MNSSENIKNALKVIFKTYENVEKLMEHCKTIASEKTHYINSIPKFLRRKSDNLTEAWLLNDFILLFQNKNSEECESGNGWRNGPLYVLEICLGEKGSDNIPLLYISKFEYESINEWSEGCSPANHWAFYYPLRNENSMIYEIKGEYKVTTPKNEKSSKSYWGLYKVTSKTINLLEVTSNNLQEKIFGEFDRLMEMI
jgi:hypothetical protein